MTQTQFRVGHPPGEKGHLATKVSSTGLVSTDRERDNTVIILQAPSQTLTLGNLPVDYSLCAYDEGLGKQGLLSKNLKCPQL